MLILGKKGKRTEGKGSHNGRRQYSHGTIKIVTGENTQTHTRFTILVRTLHRFPLMLCQVNDIFYHLNHQKHDYNRSQVKSPLFI